MTTDLARIEARAGAYAATVVDGGSVCGPIEVVVVDTVVDAPSRRTTVRFVFDFLVLYLAQSGSDWYDHHVVAGRAVFADGGLVESPLAPRPPVRLSEFEVEWAPEERRYDRSVLRQRVVDELRQALLRDG